MRRLGSIVLAAATLAGCENGTADNPGGVARGVDTLSTVTILDPNYEVIFNPSWSMPARFLVFSPLVGTGEDGAIEPRLARRWQHSDDHREWTFHLRSDVRWHDGAPFSARDVAFTIRMMSHPEVAYRPRPDTVIVANDSTVTIRWDRPRDALDWWWVYYPEHLLRDVAPADFFAADFWTRPVGTGPFRYARHVPRTVVELEANPEYFRGPPAVDRVRIKFGGGDPLVELRSGNVDAATYVSRALVPRLREDPDFRVYYGIYRAVTDVEAFYWNHRHPLLGDRAVRRALVHAIDRNELRRLLNLPGDLPVFDVLFTPRQFWARELPPPLPYDPARARALLDSAGWRDADGDGVRERGATSASFTALAAAGGTAASGVAAVYIQEALRDVGVRMEIQRLESGLVHRFRSGDFEAGFRPFNRIEVPKRLWGPDAPHGYHDPELSRIFTAMDTVLDPAARAELFRRTWPILMRDLPALFLGPQVQHFVAHRRIRGLSSPFRAHPYIGIAEARVRHPEDR